MAPVIPGTGTTLVYSNDFDAAPIVAGGVAASLALNGGFFQSVQNFSTLGAGFAGNFLRNASGGNPAGQTTLTLTGLPSHTSVDLDFLAAIIDSWDGSTPVGGLAPPDFFNVEIDGSLVFSETFDNFVQSDGSYTPPAGGLLTPFPLSNLGGTSSWADAAYDMGLESAFDDIPHTFDTLTIRWFASGSGWQAGNDESWAIENVEVTLGGTGAGVINLDAAVIDEGGSVTVTGSFIDVGTEDTHSVLIDWGAGETSSAAVVTQGAGSGTFTATHQYSDDNPTTTASDVFTITATLTDDDGGSDSASTTVTVNNVAPEIVSMSLSSASIDEGQSVTVSGTFSDPALGVSTEIFTGTALWSDGVSTAVTVDGTAGTFSTTRAFPDDHPSTGTSSDPFTVDITINDDDGGSDAQTSPVLTVNNVAPEIVSMSLSSASIDEGQSVTVSGSFTDPALGVATEVFTGTALWSDGVSTAVTVDGTAGTFSTTRSFPDDSPTGTSSDPFTVDITINDDDGGSDTETSPVLTVNNVDPVIVGINDVAISTYVIAVGDSATFSGSFTDVGVEDTHTAVWTFSHVVSLAPVEHFKTVVVTPAAGGGSVSDLISFTDAGVYTAKLTITDDDTGEVTSQETMFVVYDPSAGFVTGGGWINSPEGAYVADPTLTGKANFGFVSKYQKGADTPVGQTEFQFKAGNLNFHSSDYIWLVISGARAQYNGTGTINGTGNYGFKVTAIDGQVTGGLGIDKFRIKIWDIDNGHAVVYDNELGAGDDATPSTTLGGGKIIIHTKGKALLAAGGAARDGAALSTLSYATLQPVVNQAIRDWAAEGVDAAKLDRLSGLDVQIADLSGSYLGMASASTNIVWIDRDAAGYGWGAPGSSNLLATVRHELGHVLGLDHDVLGEELAIVGAHGSDARSATGGLRGGIAAVDSIYSSLAERDGAPTLRSSEDSRSADTPLHARRDRGRFFDALGASRASLRRLRTSRGRVGDEGELVASGLRRHELDEQVVDELASAQELEAGVARRDR